MKYFLVGYYVFIRDCYFIIVIEGVLWYGLIGVYGGGIGEMNEKIMFLNYIEN